MLLLISYLNAHLFVGKRKTILLWTSVFGNAYNETDELESITWCGEEKAGRCQLWLDKSHSHVSTM